MKTVPKSATDQAIAWCQSVLGPVEIMSDHSKEHGDHESATCRLRALGGFCYLKIHQTRAHWNNEVHAYERWAHAFGARAPRLLGLHEVEPLALIISEQPGEIVEDMPLTPSQERAIWHTAGAALAPLHDLEVGACFGPCEVDGSCAESAPLNAREYVSQKLAAQIEQAERFGWINAEELATLQAAQMLIPAFEGERPRPCHRDYCSANWLVTPQKEWVGVIDFEFAYWDVRVADFSRDPHWSWIDHPERWEAFFEGYGRLLTPQESQQLLVAHAEYALGAIVWGHQHAFYGFECEGRKALAHLATLLR